MKIHFAAPAWVLFFLSPVIGELLSSSAPPLEFFNPFTFIMLTLFYGCGVLLVRELAYRWGRGWPTILLLGAAYAIIEEGLAVKSFFDPNWVDLDQLGNYGRWAGANWVWTLLLINYHTVFSIAIPILLVNLIFPAWHNRPWVGRRILWLLGSIFTLETVLIYFFLTPYSPPWLPYLLACLLVLGLVYLAWRWPPRSEPAMEQAQVSRPRWFGLLGFAATFTLYLLAWTGPEWQIAPGLTLLSMLGLSGMVIWLVPEMAGHGAWQSPHQLALASGALSFFILLTPINELENATRPDNTAGMSLVGLAMILFLAWLAWRIRRYQTYQTSEYGGVS
jgi:hypothetical protein